MNKSKKRKTSRVESKFDKKIEKPKENKKEKKKKKRSILSFLFSLIITIILILIILVTTCFGYYFIKDDFDVSKAWNHTINKFSLKPRPITVLVLGVSTDISTELADTIMICHYNPDSQNAYIISIPRDTFVGENKNKAKGKDKLNSMYSKKGIKEMTKKIEEITNIDIDYYAVVKNQGLIDIVDAIGGVDFDVPIDMNYDDVTQDLHIHLNSGIQKIDGKKAEQLLRFRHNNNGSSYPSSYGDNDFGRMRTQREFIKETAKQTLRLGNVTNLNKIAKTVFNNVDTNMNAVNIMKYVPVALNFEIDSLETYQLPGEAKKCNSLWFYIHNPEETEKLVNELKTK